MGKKISKLVTLLFLLATSLGGALAGYAVDQTDPLDPAMRPTEGDLTIHKYWAETATEVGAEGDGTKLEDDAAPSNSAIKGIQFDVYLMTPVDEDTPETPPSDKDGWSYSRSGTNLTVEKGSTTYTYTLQLKDADVDYTGGKTDASGILKYTELEAGYYYVEENLAASTGYTVDGYEAGEKVITSASKPFIVAVPMTHPDGDKWNSDVHVYPKNQGLNPEKKPNKPSVTVGQKVEWTITANVPSDIATYTKFDIIDELDQRLNYVADSVVVKGLDTNGDAVVTLASPADYTVEVTPATESAKETIKISLTQAGIAELAAAEGIAKLSVSFATTVNGNIADVENGNNDPNNIIKNDAKIEFENDSTTETETITTPPAEVETGEILIDKKASDGETDLAGAEFQLAPSSDDANDGNFYKVLLDSTNTHIVEILTKGHDDYDSAVNWVVRPHATTGLGYDTDDGTFYATSFEGLMIHSVGANDTTSWNSYWVVETKAPDGYNLLGSPVEVTFKSGLTNCVLTETVINKKGFTLPNTGGVGAILLVVSGIVLIGLAVILTMNNKKKTA